MNNQIDLAKIYGIEGGVGSTQMLEPRNFLSSQNIPSLEQIAEYNVASQGIDPNQGINTLESNYQAGVPIDYQDTQVPFVPTPTTTLDQSMNIDTSMRTTEGVQITDFSNPFPVTPESIQYLNGFIRTQIGRRINVTFLVGSNTLEEKNGYLLGVGANYILINEIDTNDLTACDFYNIKFIRFYY